MKFTPIVALLCGLLTLNTPVVQADQVQPPLRFRFSTQAWRKFTQFRDQDVFIIFKDNQVDYSEENTTQVEKVQSSLQPQKGSIDDYDFDLKLKGDYLGAEANDLELAGKVTVKGEEYDFKVPIKLAKFKYSLKDVENENMGFTAT